MSGLGGSDSNRTTACF